MTCTSKTAPRNDMSHIYLDNFRGFQDAKIPILDVNFLVGENSTGKTSFLNVLKMFSGPTFMMGDAAIGDEQIFGHFEEMVSAHSRDKSHFRLGYAGVVRNEKGARAVHCIFITYKKINGLAKIVHFSYVVHKKQIDLWFEKDKVFFRNVDAAEESNIAELGSCLSKLLQWFVCPRCCVVCTDEERAVPYLKRKEFYPTGMRPPLIYRDEKHARLCCNGHVVGKCRDV